MSDVFGVAGATSSVSLVFILPGIFYYKINVRPIPAGVFIIVIVFCCFFCQALHHGPATNGYIGLGFAILGFLLGAVCLAGIIMSYV